MLFGLFFWADRECGYDSLRFRRLFAIIGKKERRVALPSINIKEETAMNIIAAVDRKQGEAPGDDPG